MPAMKVTVVDGIDDRATFRLVEVNYDYWLGRLFGYEYR
jgi:hypothetical protein